MTPADLAARIASLGLTQTEAAQQMGLTQPELSRWIHGHVRITTRRAAWLDQELRQLERPTDSTADPTTTAS